MEVGKTSYSHLGIYGRAFGGGSFIISYKINDRKREEEIVRNSLSYSLKLKICYLLKTVFKSKRIVIFKISKKYSRAREKYARKQQKSECYHYTEPRGILTIITNPTLQNYSTPTPYSPIPRTHKNTLSTNKARNILLFSFQNKKNTRLTSALRMVHNLDAEYQKFYGNPTKKLLQTDTSDLKEYN